MIKKLIIIKWLKYVIALSVVIFAIYINHLNDIVITEFSKPLEPINSTLKLEDYPKPLTNMLLLIEDRSFFDHFGVDFKEIIRVLYDVVFYDKPLRGASTITQQLIKNKLLTREHSFKRKVKEALMALLLEFSFNKNFILNNYMNTVYLGQNGGLSVNGFDNAARFYFNKEIKLLSLTEMAMLVALVKGPSFYNPSKYSQRLIKRSRLVLNLYNKYKKIIK